MDADNSVADSVIADADTVIEGTEDENVLDGTGNVDAILGGEGKDIISGKEGNDALFGGNGYPFVAYILTIKQSLQGLPRKEIEKKEITRERKAF